MNKFKTLTTTALLTLMGAALIGTDAFARGGDGPGHGPGHSSNARMTILERLDTDADGVLSMDEFSVRNTVNAQRRFFRKDTDSDTLLSLQEFSAKANRRDRPNLDELDGDALSACMVEALGYELPARPDSETAFYAADLNADQSIDFDEFLAASDLHAEERFVEIDTDDNAQLSSAEIEAYQALREERRNAHRGCVVEQLEEETLMD